MIKQFENNNLEPKLIKIIEDINEEQPHYFLEKIKSFYGSIEGKTFAVIGLAFKPDTDDLRESRRIKLIDMLPEEGL